MRTEILRGELAHSLRRERTHKGQAIILADGDFGTIQADGNNHELNLTDACFYNEAGGHLSTAGELSLSVVRRRIYK